MNKLAKTLVTALIVVIAFFLLALVQGFRQMQGIKGGGFGILGGIVLCGAYYAIRAVWKKDDKKNNKGDDTSVILQK